ncbi:MAG: mechanosensitive ion channel domain-containing protein, partial [Chitinophagaceae bacterium]
LEAIYLQSEAYHDSRFSDFINYNVLQHRFERILWILASIVWFVALLRYLTLFDFASHLVRSFFTTPRMIGSMGFTFGSVAIFICIIWISSVISRVINFFFGNKNVVYSDKRGGLGSIMLLVRLAIWSLGFLVAVAATGIPLDKLSLMIGALGVGIGFGLQNIVNNLVSGVILAFERPIQVGDEIEIGNKSGVIKEIGVRSSKIRSIDGADIIVPNGDLLSQHLINWTMQDRNKRVEFVIGITYEADLKQVKSLIQETLLKNENILQPPEPIVILQAFTDLAIEVKILFWASELSKAGTLRSNVMMEVFEALSAAGVPLAHAKKL